MTHQVEISEIKNFLYELIQEQVNDRGLSWINQQKVKLEDNFQIRSFYLAFSSVPRFIDKDPLRLTEEQIAEADRLRNGFQPKLWNLVQCARTYLLLLVPNENAEEFIATLTKIFETADMDEQVALFGALPLLPYPEKLEKRAAEGIRTNITAVFDAIALHNPFPKDYLNEEAWNQMILKAVFMQRPMYRIYGAEERSNPELARMLIDFAHERWAAGRQVWPELWRFVAPFIDKNNLTDILKATEGEPLEKKAGLLACASSDEPEARQLLNQYPDIKEDIQTNRLDWRMIGIEAEDKVL